MENTADLFYIHCCALSCNRPPRSCVPHSLPATEELYTSKLVMSSFSAKQVQHADRLAKEMMAEGESVRE